MIPIKADLPTRTFPLVTILIISINIFVFLYEISLGEYSEQFILTFGAIPFKLTHIFPLLTRGEPISPIFKSMITSMFLHGGFWHVGGNMLYLWIFGNNIEDEMGHLRFIFFYLLCGVIAVYSHAAFDPMSQVPMIGASGAVSGVLGAYLIRFPGAKILTLVPLGFFVHMIRIPAIIVLGFWIVAQLANGMFSPQGGGVAWFAHVGGFIAGMLLIYKFSKRRKKGIGLRKSSGTPSPG
ncbi:MAG: rhomboid family intramembrane serine protease [Nitrospira sp.]|nr:rhomboid family intramembrane serine protease [Candidatus Manganitrophaceae bacterium]HIL35389.1 rhomboid family intramembrane serine protease [Candidatus Manganitrophaceae bacterium]